MCSSVCFISDLVILLPTLDHSRCPSGSHEHRLASMGPSRLALHLVQKDTFCGVFPFLLICLSLCAMSTAGDGLKTENHPQSFLHMAANRVAETLRSHGAIAQRRGARMLKPMPVSIETFFV